MKGASFVVRENETDDRNGYGTAIASIVSALAPRAKILPVKVLDETGSGDESSMIQATEFAITEGADIVLIPAGTVTGSFDSSQQLSRVWRKALDTATSANVLVIASSGDDAYSSGRVFEMDTTENIRDSFDALPGEGSDDSIDSRLGERSKEPVGQEVFQPHSVRRPANP